MQTFRIRPAVITDAQAMQDIMTPYITDSLFSYREEIPPLEFFEEVITRPHPSLVAEDDRGVVGFIFVSPSHPYKTARYSVKLTLYVSNSARTGGIGTAMFKALLEELKTTDFVQIISIITDQNSPSIRFHEKHGFEKIAYHPNMCFKFGQWIGDYWYVLKLKDHSEITVD